MTINWFYVKSCDNGSIMLFSEEWQAFQFRSNENDQVFDEDQDEVIITNYPWSEPKPLRLKEKHRNDE